MAKDKALYAEVRRIDELMAKESERVDGRFSASETATTTALSAAEKAVVAALQASEKAVNKAEEAQLRVNETQNEFRGTLRDQAQQLMPRAETELVFSEFRREIAALRSTVDIGPPTLKALQADSDQGTGRRAGTTQTWTDLRSLALIAIAAAGFIYGIVKP